MFDVGGTTVRNRMSRWMVWLCLVGWTGPAGAATVFSFNGVGDPVRRIDVRSKGMGGAGRALIDAGNFDQGNFSSANPALLAGFARPALSSLYFVHRRTLNDGQQTHAVSDGDLGAFQMVLPFWRRTVVGIGVEPLTDLDFGLVDTVGTGDLRHKLSIDGTGGIQAVSLRFGQRVGQKVYLGARMDLVVLGTITETWSKDFDSQAVVDAEDRFVDTFSGSILQGGETRTVSDSEDRIVRTHRGVLPAFGAIFTPSNRWRVGAALQIKRTVKQTRHLRNFWAERGFEREVVSETDIKLPTSLGGGIAYSTGYKWMAALDVEKTFWSQTGSGRYDTLELAGGVLYRAGQADPMSQSKRIEWMGGMHYRSLYFQTASGSQISEVGVSLGIGLPLHNRAGKFRYVLEIGKRGDVGRHGVSERFISQTFSLSGWLN